MHIRYRSIKLEICQIQQRIEILEELGDGYNEIVQPLRDLYCEKIQALIEGQLQTEKAIAELDSTKRELMQLRYIDGADWTEVAATIHYEWTQSHRIHAQALAKLRAL